MQLKVMRDSRSAGKKIDTKSFKKFLQEQQRLLERTDEEIVEEEKVQVGYVDEVLIPDAPMECAAETMRMAKRARVD